MNQKIIRTTISGSISEVEANHIKAKTKLINHSNIKEWVTLILGAAIIIIGLILFILNSGNAYFIALMTVGVFILAGKKPKIEEMLGQTK